MEKLFNETDLRDWFAGLALIGIEANSRNMTYSHTAMAIEAYGVAECMLHQRKLELEKTRARNKIKEDV